MSEETRTISLVNDTPETWKMLKSVMEDGASRWDAKIAALEVLIENLDNEYNRMTELTFGGFENMTNIRDEVVNELEGLKQRWEDSRDALRNEGIAELERCGY